MNRLGAWALVCVLAGSGCTTRLGDFTVASHRNVPSDFKRIGGKVTGEDCTFGILGIPIGTLNPTIDGATDAAIEKASGADGLIDVVIFADMLDVVLYQRRCITVEGQPISTR